MVAVSSRFWGFCPQNIDNRRRVCYSTGVLWRGRRFGVKFFWASPVKKVLFGAVHRDKLRFSAGPLVLRGVNVATRTGVPTMHKLTRLLCIAIAKFRPIIYKLYPDNTVLLAALETASVACAAFLAQLELVRDYGD